MTKPTRDQILKTIVECKHFWMNQRQNDERDFQNYFHRAAGIDSNMKHDLARRIDKLIGSQPQDSEGE